MRHLRSSNGILSVAPLKCSGTSPGDVSVKRKALWHNGQTQATQAGERAQQWYLVLIRVRSPQCMRPAHPCISRARRQIGIQTPTTRSSPSRPSLVLVVAIMGQVSALLCVVSALVSASGDPCAKRAFSMFELHYHPNFPIHIHP